MLMPFRKKLLPAAPSAVNVLWRSLVAHQRYDTLPAAPLDMVMRPPRPLGVDVTDFDRHTDIFWEAYLWARQAIVALEAEGDPAIAAMLAASKPMRQNDPVAPLNSRATLYPAESLLRRG